MSNPTNPFSWQMPENTDLVTDLPADFEVFGQAVATSLQDLLGGTTGQVLKKNTNADMDFVWSADAAGMTNPMTTTGDVIYSSPGSTPVRLGIGTANQVLAVNSGATAPEWVTPAAGGGMTLLSTTTLSGASTTISSISGSYKSLVAYIYRVNLASDGRPEIRPNNTNNINAIFNYSEDGSPYAGGTNNGSITQPGTMVQNNANNAYTLIIDNYASSTSYKPFQYYGQYEWSAWTTALNSAGSYQSNTAITSLVFTQTGGNFTSGTVLLYGVN